MKHKMHCSDLLKSISDYVDGELDSELCIALETHLAECQNCQIVVNTTKKTVELYHATSENVTLPQDIEKRLFKRLNLEDFTGNKK